MRRYIFENSFSLTVISVLGIGLTVCFALKLWIPIILIMGIIIFNLIFYSIEDLNKLLVISMILSLSPKSVYIAYPFMIMLFLYSMIINISSRKFIPKADIISIGWMLISIIGAITIYKWQLPWLGIQWYLALALLPWMIYLLIKTLKHNEIVWIVQKGFPYIFAVIVAFTFIQILVLLSEHDFVITATNIMKFHRLSLPGNGSNRLAGILVFVSILGLTIYPLCRGTWIKNAILYVTASLALFFSFLIMSRGSILALLLTAGIYMLIKFKSKRQKMPNISKLVIVLLVVVVLIFSIMPFINIISYRMKIAKFDYSSIYRLILWYNSIESIINNPIIGTGPGQHRFEIITDSHEDPHNFILRYGVDFGGLSLLIVLIILAYPFILLYKTYKKDKNLGLFLISIFIPPSVYIIFHSLMEYLISSRGFSPLFWFYWAIFTVIMKDEVLSQKLYSINNANTINNISI